jgi:hypothetical protein
MRGRFVLPGHYQIRLTVGDRVHLRTLIVRTDPKVTSTVTERESLDATLDLQSRLVGAAALSGAAVDTVLSHLGTVLESLSEHPEAPPTLVGRVEALKTEARNLHVLLEGPGQEGIAQQETVLPLSALAGRLYSTTEGWSGPPTQDQARLTALAHEQVAEVLSRLEAMLEGDLPGLQRSMADAGIPWPAGPPPALPQKLIPPFIS